MNIFNQESALVLLRAAKVFYTSDDRSINMNDTFGWGMAYGPNVSDDQLVIVADLFWRYGNAGLNYWCTIHPDEEERVSGSEFEDIQRSINFVRHEEKLRLSGMDSDKRAYHKLVYTLG